MGSDATDVAQVPKSSFDVKVHSSLCRALRDVLDRIGCVLPEIESARPGCTSGIKELCSLYNTIDKAKLVLQHCAESSKLYLAITAEATLCRCERIRVALDQSLCQIQNMISDVISYLKDREFIIDSADEEAGKTMLELLRQTETSEKMEFEAFQIAAFGLNMASPKALLIERRSVKKLLDKICGNDAKKEIILNYFLYLLKKYGKKLMSVHNGHIETASPKGLISTKCNTSVLEIIDESTYHDVSRIDLPSSSIPPEEFCCPISSKLMYDPVIVASGQTYEKTCIEKWFDDGHDTCPKTQQKLESMSMISNTCMKDLISNWCINHGLDVQDLCVQPDFTTSRCSESSHLDSVSSLKNVSAALLYGNCGDRILQNNYSNISFISSDASYCYDISHDEGIQDSENHAHMFQWSDDYQKSNSFCNFNHDMYVGFFSMLSDLSLELQDKAVQDFEILLEDDETTCNTMLSNDFAKALMKFFMDTNMQAQKTGAQILLSFLSNIRVEIPSFNEDTFQFLTSLLESEIRIEALLIMRKLANNTNFVSYTEEYGVPLMLIKILDSENTELVELAVGILYDLSFHDEIKAHISSSGCLSKLVPLLSNSTLAKYCISMMRNLCDAEEAAKIIAETEGCLASIAEVLESGTREEQEQAVVILHSLCSRSFEYCQLVLKECVIPPLVYISVNGNPIAKASSTKLLHLLRDL